MRTTSVFILCLFLCTATAHADNHEPKTPSSAPASAPTRMSTEMPREMPRASLKAPTKKPSIIWGYKSGFFAKTADNKYKIKIGGWAHINYTAKVDDGELKTNEIKLSKARLLVKATTFKYLHTFLLLEFMNELPVLEYSARFQPYEALGLKVGGFKVPMGRQWICPAWKRAFVSGALSMVKFKPGYDLGVNVLGSFSNHLIEYQAGVFNGSGVNKPQDNTDMLVVARVAVNPLGPTPMTESDFKGTPTPRLSVGLGATYNPISKTTSSQVIKDNKVVTETVTAGSKVMTLGSDLAFIYKGSATIAEFFYRSTWPDEKDRVDSLGWMLQSSYFFLPKRLQAGLRASMVRMNMDKDDADLWELSTVAAYYIYKTQFVLQGEYSMRLTKKSKTDDLYSHSAQLQVLFRF